MNPKGKKPMPTVPEEWVSHAESDLAMARLGDGKPGVQPQQICFHAQHAAEKALKAALLFHKIDFAWTHDITELTDIFEEAGITLPEDFQDAGDLTPYAVESRYPKESFSIVEINRLADCCVRGSYAMRASTFAIVLHTINYEP